ncbi:MAG: heparinase II/III family protein [Hyphococcus sp.]
MAGAYKRSDGAPSERASGLLARVQRAWGESPFYQAQLKGPAPDRLLVKPDDPFTPDKDLARSFLTGRLAFGDETIDCEGEIERFWDLAAPNGQLFSFLQEFSWLRHVAALGDEGRHITQELTGAWLHRYEKWAAEAWAPCYVAERLVHMCAHHQLVLSQRDALWRSRVLTSMARQIRHLARTAHRAETGFDRLMASLALSIVGFTLPGCEGPAERGLEMARRELRLQMRPDGGHVSRNPSRQLKLSVRLQTALKAIEARGFQAPGFLRHAAARAGAMAMFFRCGDGRLAVFNGGYEDDGAALTSLHNDLDPEAGPSDFARHSGYHKLTAGRALVILDAASETPGAPFHSAGSLHFSSGRSRIVVNCGNGGHRAPEWRKALAQRAAHSALSFEGQTPDFGHIAHRRAEEPKGQLLEFERTLSTVAAPQATYLRRLFLPAGGAGLKGEEVLEGVPTEVAAAAVWRFHLHPSVRASIARDRRSVILLLPNKEGWRFKSNCLELMLEKTIYCGRGGAPETAEQIVLRPGEWAASKTVKWAFQRLDAV